MAYGSSPYSILRRKPVDEVEDENSGSGLFRTLGLWQLTAIGLGAIIGAGIFALAGPVAKADAGPAVSLSFLLAGFASACAALSYAEFGGLIPQPGRPTPMAMPSSANWSAGSSAGTCCWSTPRSWRSSPSASPLFHVPARRPSASICRPGCWRARHRRRAPCRPFAVLLCLGWPGCSTAASKTSARFETGWCSQDRDRAARSSSSACST